MRITEKKYYPWLLVACLSLMGFCFPAAVTQFSMVSEELATALNVPKQTVLLADTMRAICLVIAMFLSGPVYQRLDMRRTMALGIGFQVGSQLLIPLAVRFRVLPLFFVFKAMQGLNAVAFPLYIAAINQWMDSSRSGLATAIFNGSFTAGAGVGAWAVGLIVPALGWESSFYAIGGACLLFALPVLLLVREKPEAAALRKAAPRKTGKKAVYAEIIKMPVTWLMVITLVANTWVCQAITVDMSVYAQDIGYSYGQTGTMMMLISIVTVVSSILAGGVSDHFASRSKDPVKVRSVILALGYVLSAAAALILPMIGTVSYGLLAVVSCLMMFGASWSGGVFWALPAEIYDDENVVAGTAFCSGASNIPNPIAPMVVGVLLGTRGYWTAGWFTCCAASILSVAAALLIASKGRKD